MAAMSLPIIDISPFLPSNEFDLQAQRKCANEIFAACSSTGFFYLANHGIPTSLTDAVLSLGRDFFLESSAEEKAAVMREKVGVGNGDGARGWQPVRDNVTQGKRDWQEALDLYCEDEETENDGTGRAPPYELLKGRNPWPQRPEQLRGTYEEYVERMLHLGKAVVTAMGAALDVDDEEIFARHTEKSFWGMRLIGYSPIPESPVANRDDGISCGEHTDYGCVTLLLTDSVKGALQVKTTSNAWIDADPIPGAFVVNIGDMMERWTNGLWKSTTHRVIHRGDGFRVSVPFFYEPEFEACIKPLVTCIDRTGGVARYNDTIYGKHLLSKVSKNFASGITGDPVAEIALPAMNGHRYINSAPLAYPATDGKAFENDEKVDRLDPISVRDSERPQKLFNQAPLMKCACKTAATSHDFELDVHTPMKATFGGKRVLIYLDDSDSTDH